MAERVLILGASRPYLPAIHAARRVGCEVIVTDRDPNACGFSHADHYAVVDITDIEGTVAVAERFGARAVVPVNDFGVPTAAEVAERLGLVGISRGAAACATDKALMRTRWQDQGVPSPRFCVVQDVDEAITAIDKVGGFPVIVKPSDSRGGGSRGVSLVESLSGLANAVSFAQSFYSNTSMLVEECLVGVEHSVETITLNGEVHVLAISDKVKSPYPYRVDLSVNYPSSVSTWQLAAVKEVAALAVRALGITVGAAHVELCTTKDGPKLFELGARCGGGGTPDPIVPYVTGVDMFQEVVRILLGRKPRRLTPTLSRGCVYRFLAPRPGILRRVNGLEDVRKWEGVLDADLLVKPGDVIRPIRTGHDRAGFVIAGAETLSEALSLADRAQAHIRFETE